MRNPTPIRLVPAVPLLAAAFACPVAATSAYRVTLLQPLEGIQSQALTINSAGMAAGHASDVSLGSYPVAVVWDDDGAPTYLTGNGVSGALVQAINEAGLMVGGSDSLANQQTSHGGFQMVLGQEIEPLGDFFAPLDVNGSGAMAGTIRDEIGNPIAARRAAGSDGVVTVLGSLDEGYQSFAHAMNDQGVIVGVSDSAAGPTFAVRWTDGAPVILEGLPEAEMGWFEVSRANDVNEQGVVVGGAFFNSFSRRAVRWTGGVAEPLPQPDGHRSSANAVNDHGHIVGYLSPPQQSSRAALWRDGAVFDLNTLIDPRSGWFLESATDINNSGQIVGYGWTDGLWVGFRLDPICPADITGPDGVSDGNVDALDLLLMISQWGSPCDEPCAADITGHLVFLPDGSVNALDFLALLAQWGSPAVCPVP